MIAAQRRRGELLAAAVEHARHILPSQAPIRVFVHHNTLHALEDLPFDEAVLRGAELYGTEPYESEEAFGAHLRAGRITSEDIREVVDEEGFSGDRLLPGGPSVRSLRALRLSHPLERVQGPALRWLLDEGGALERFHDGVAGEARDAVRASAARALGAASVDGRRALVALWDCLEPHAPAASAPAPGPRPRDRVLASHGVDVDELTHPLLIRVCGAFVDQGLAYWPMPGRDRGLLAAFRGLYGRPLAPPDPWLSGLAEELVEAAGRSGEETALDALDALGVPESRWADVVEATLLALKGWAGMIAQLEDRPDRAPVAAPPARLVDFLALALTLEARAVRHVLVTREPVDRLRPRAPDLALAYEGFVLAQLAGVGPAALSEPAHARAWLADVSRFDSHARRRLWHRAYERRHRRGVLDALLAHGRLGVPELGPPRVQALFCIDEREESLRRHLEEADPTLETIGYAGFYGVPMAYEGLTDVQPTPLCPVTVRPKHVVVEQAIEEAAGRASAARRGVVGRVRHGSHVGSQTFVRGGVLSATVGLAAAVPLVGRVLFPRLSERLAHAADHAASHPPATRLRIERHPDDAFREDGLLPGFTVEEMVGIVRDVLRTSGLEGRLAPLVIVVGHGSSSLNNPHEAAHDCGATGGGRGGPNARAFAAMANHPAVRRRLEAGGAPIPEESWFVGAYHNTCDDRVDWYDLDLVPETHRDELERCQAQFDHARRLDAHERCRRFESAPLDIEPRRALAHVEARAVDLGEPRPEYGHATNAVCIVGRRQHTRGLFLDRRAFLVSYDPTRDPDGAVLGPLLASVGPVGAGINLEYYFSFVDPDGYGSGTKLPHNVTGLVGVMNGHASDLRTGLPWQMVEIHEPVRLLTIVEAKPELLGRLLDKHPGVARVVRNGWIQLAAWDPLGDRMWVFEDGELAPYQPRSRTLRSVETSMDHYRGRRDHLGVVRVEAALRGEAS